LQRVGIGGGIGAQLSAAIQYADATGVARPTFVSRYVGDSQWFMLAPELTIPDAI
jgi:hypothetical protein